MLPTGKEGRSYLQCLLVVLDVIPIDVVVRSDRFPQLSADDHAGAFGSRSTSEEHDTTSSVLERGLKQADGNGESDTGASQASAVVGHGPGVLLELLEGLGQLELSLLDGEQEAGGRATNGPAGLLGLVRRRAGAESRLGETQHVLDLLRGVFLATTEDVRLGTLDVAELVDLGHGSEGDQANESMVRQEIQARDQGLLEGRQAVLFLAGIDDVEEDGRARSRSGELVLDGGVGRVQLEGNALGGDVFVVRGKAVPRQAEGADPDACPNVDLAEGIQYGTAGLLAGDGLHLEDRSVRLLFERRVQGTDGDDEPRRFLSQDAD